VKQFLFYSLLLLVACGNNSTEAPIATSTTDEKSESTTSSPAQNNQIVGEWELVGSVLDTNDNLQIDEAERKNLKAASYKDYMKLNSDGTGLFTVAKMEGRYDAKAKETGGKKYLTWYDKANGPHPMGTIVFVSKDELHIKEPGGHGLIVWKKS
jgi:hypothetical protein